MGTRKSFGPHRREKKFFVVGTKGAGQDYWTFYTSLRFVDRHPGKAKRFYSKKAATAFKAEADGRDNPHMSRVVLKAVETVKGIDIHVPSTYRKNPSWTPKRDKEESYKNRRVFLRAKAAKKKGRKPVFLNLKTQGTRDAISDYRLGRRDPDRAFNRYEDHTYATAYRATMNKMISRKGR